MADGTAESDDDAPAEGGGVRRLSVGAGVGVGVGSGDALGSGVGSGVAAWVGAGVGVGDSVGAGVGFEVGTGVGSVVGVTTTPAGVGVPGRGVAVGTAVCSGVGASVGVTSGAIVTREVKAGSWATNCEAAKTNALPSRATVTIVTTSVPVVRIAPRRTWSRRSASQERCSWRRRRSA